MKKTKKPKSYRRRQFWILCDPSDIAHWKTEALKNDMSLEKYLGWLISFQISMEKGPLVSLVMDTDKSLYKGEKAKKGKKIGFTTKR